MPKTILIVDDSAADLAALRLIVQALGFDSVTASNGQEALLKAGSAKPSLVLMDIVMPGMDGYECCRQLLSDPAMRDVPIVFVSSKCQKADQMWAVMQGGKTIIGKPVNADSIAGALRAYG